MVAASLTPSCPGSDHAMTLPSLLPAAWHELSEQVIEASRAGTALRIVGMGTRSFLGDPGPGRPLSTLGLQGIVNYQPAELFITAQAGTPLAHLEDILAQHGQYLAFEPPRFAMPPPGGGTVGGMVAAGISGPGRMAGGSVRDALLGAVVLDGHGQVLRFGGQVIKNVAGYDVSRLMAGALGTLGVLLEVTLRVAPQPAASATRHFQMPQAQALEQVNRWVAQAHPIQASAWHQGTLWVRLAGAHAAVREAEQVLGGEAVSPEHAERDWRQLRDHHHAVLQRDQALPLWRLAVPPTHPPLALAGPTLVEWHGGQRWLRTDLPASAVRAAARAAGGHATRWHRGSSGADPDASAYTPLGGAMALIERRLKHAFDPAGIFNPGRRPFADLPG